MKIIGKIVVGAAAICAFSTAAFTQVRTFGPASPYLVTGRSVSVPSIHNEAQQPFDETGQKNAPQGESAPAIGAEPTADKSAPQ